MAGIQPAHRDLMRWTGSFEPVGEEIEIRAARALALVAPDQESLQEVLALLDLEEYLLEVVS